MNTHWCHVCVHDKWCAAMSHLLNCATTCALVSFWQQTGSAVVPALLLAQHGLPQANSPPCL